MGMLNVRYLLIFPKKICDSTEIYISNSFPMCQSEMDGKYDTALAPTPRLLFGQQLLLLLFILLSWSAW